jgi:DNA-nicking Smr family endonuclease
MTRDEAAAALRRKLRECRETGISRLLIIHGQGWHSKSEEGPVLKNLVLTMLENECRDLAASYRPAKQDEGGGGATMVMI